MTNPRSTTNAQKTDEPPSTRSTGGKKVYKFKDALEYNAKCTFWNEVTLENGWARWVKVGELVRRKKDDEDLLVVAISEEKEGSKPKHIWLYKPSAHIVLKTFLYHLVVDSAGPEAKPNEVPFLPFSSVFYSICITCQAVCNEARTLWRTKQAEYVETATKHGNGSPSLVVLPDGVANRADSGNTDSGNRGWARVTTRGRSCRSTPPSLVFSDDTEAENGESEKKNKEKNKKKNKKKNGLGSTLSDRTPTEFEGLGSTLSDSETKKEIDVDKAAAVDAKKVECSGVVVQIELICSQQKCDTELAASLEESRKDHVAKKV